MANAIEIFGTGFKNGSITCLARIVGAEGLAIVQADITAITYTVYALGHCRTRTAVDGHEDNALEVEDVIFDTPQTDATWTVDETGFNFRHILDVSSNPAFVEAGHYLIEYLLIPVYGQTIILRFRVDVL